MKRHNFTDAISAEIFVRDKALCAATGMNLWLLDHGIFNTPTAWVDHIKAASKGVGGL